MPFTAEKDLDITRFGSEVIIKIRTATGYLVNVIPLPMITYNMEMLQANLDNNVLNIIFEKKFFPLKMMGELDLSVYRDKIKPRWCKLHCRKR